MKSDTSFAHISHRPEWSQVEKAVAISLTYKYGDYIFIG